MGYVIRMPQLGMSMEQGTVVEWAVGEGEAVEEEAVLAVVESEKTTAEVDAREDGTLRRVLVPEGGTVAPGDPIGILAGPDEDLAPYEEGLDAPSTAVGEEAEAGAETDGEAASAAGADAEGGSAESAGGRDVRATPGARRLAEDEGVDLAAVDGTGPQGVVTEDDVREHRPTTEGGATRTVVETRALSAVQRTVGERLGKSYREAVHVTLNRSVDAGALTATVEAARAAGVDVSVTDLLLAALGDALAAHPAFNATFEDGEHRLVEEENVAVAVDVEDGLVTPVVPDVGEKSVEEINAVRGALTERVRAGEFTMDDLAGGTFTVSNLGPFGVDSFDPVINPPQVAVLGVGRLRDGSMTLCLSFDHRVVNGADAARFLETLADRLTDPAALAGYFDADVATDRGETAGGTRTVRVETASGYAGTYRATGHAVTFDEPVDAGGTGTGPSPVEHLLGSLGACLALSVRAMAERDGLAVGTIACDVDGSPEEGPVSAVEVDLRVGTDAASEDVQRVVTKAERACYVSRSLSEDLDVSLTWTRDSPTSQE